MNRIAVCHETGGSIGGGSQVFVHTLAALREHFDVTAVVTSPTDIPRLGRRFGVDIAGVETVIPRFGPANVGTVDAGLKRLISGSLNVFTPVRRRLVQWGLRRSCKEYDLLVYTSGELYSAQPALCYVHYPLYHRYSTDIFPSPDSSLLRWIDRSLSPIPYDESPGQATNLLTNSEWMADRLKDLYDTSPAVVNPPVDTADFDPPSLEEQNVAVVVAGRLAPRKRQLEMIHVVERVRDDGPDLTLHIVGPVHYGEYSQQVRAAADTRNWVKVHGALPRDEYVAILERCRYGLHARRNEHFGIAIAEMVAAGCLPIVPNSGGQTTIIGHQAELQFASLDEAVRRLSSIVSTPELEAQLRNGLPDVEARFGVDRFHAAMRRQVRTALSNGGG